MKMQSNDELTTYQASGSDLRIHWNIEQKTKEGADGVPYSYWEANEALCNVADAFGQLVAKIIGSVYDHGAEFAAINDGGEKYAAYQAFRVQAKELASGWLNK